MVKSELSAPASHDINVSWTSRSPTSSSTFAAPSANLPKAKSPARDGMGRSLDISLGTHSQARRNGIAWRDFPGAIWRRGNGLRRIRDHYRGAFARGRLDRHHRGRAQFALHQSHLQIWHRGAEDEIRRPARPGQKTRLLVAHRARSWLRRRRHAHRGGEERRRLGHQRREDVHDERALCRRLRRHGRHRRSRKSITASRRSSSRRELPAFAPAKRKQARPARKRHQRSCVHRLPRAG